MHPLDVIMDAWNMTNSEGVVGSSTICVATLDRKLGQLSYSNVGDCGLLVVSVSYFSLPCMTTFTFYSPLSSFLTRNTQHS